MPAMISTHPWSYRHFPLPIVSVPRQVGFYSEVKSGSFVGFDQSQLKIFRPPAAPTIITIGRLFPPANGPVLETLNLNLKAGSDSLVVLDKSTTTYRLFQWILHNREKLQRQGTRSPSFQECCGHAEFVCSRSVLADLAFTPYGATHEWVVNVVRWKDVFFLHHAKSAYSEPSDSNRDKRDTSKKLMTKFGMLVTCDVGYNDSAWYGSDCKLDSTARCAAVLRANITSANNSSGHCLLFAGGVDCEYEPGKYAMLQASTMLRGYEFYKFKILKLFLKCFFTGADRLFLGFHDYDGRLTQIGEFKVDEIPDQAEYFLGQSAWKPSVCLNFLDSFLSDLKERIRANDIDAVYQIRFIPPVYHGHRVKSGLQIKRLVESGVDGTGFEYLQSISEQFD